jgi:hypothetical protein
MISHISVEAAGIEPATNLSQILLPAAFVQMARKASQQILSSRVAEPGTRRHKLTTF